MAYVPVGELVPKGESEEPQCGLCNIPITHDPGEAFCHGCKFYICADHTGEAPWGTHDVMEHESQDDGNEE